MERLEGEVKALHVSLEQVQATLTSPELARLSLKEQLTQRQVTFALILECFCFNKTRHPPDREAYKCIYV